MLFLFCLGIRRPRTKTQLLAIHSAQCRAYKRRAQLRYQFSLGSQSFRLCFAIFAKPLWLFHFIKFLLTSY